MKLNNKKRLQFLIIVFIMFVALFLRLHNLQFMEFKGDEAFNSFKALRFVEQGHFPLTSLRSTTGINEPPLFIYLISIPYFFTRNPVLVTGFVAFFNVIGILVFFLFMRKFFDERAAMIGALFYAVNPWQILFSRKIWTQNLLAPFILLFMYFLFNAIFEKKEKHIIPAMVCLAFVVQLHLSAFYFIGVFLVSIMMYRKCLNWKYIGVGALLFLLTFTPYILFQIQNDYIDYHAFLSYLNQKSYFQIEAILFPFLLATTRGFNYSLGASYNDFLDSSISIQIIDFLQVGVLFFSIIFLMKSVKKNKVVILFSWLFLGIFFIANSKSEIVNHYFITLLPVVFIMIGNFLSWISRIEIAKIKSFTYIVVLILVSYQFIFDLYFLSFIKNEQCILGDYGPPFAHRFDRMENIIEPMDLEEIDENFNEIHLKSCSCVQCYEAATEFTIKLIKAQYQGKVILP